MKTPAAGLVRRLLSAVWRLVIYFVVLVAALQLLAAAFRSALHSLRLHFAHAAGVRPAEEVGLSQLCLLLAALLAWAVAGRLGRDRLDPILPFRAGAVTHLLQGTLWGVVGVGATLGLIAGLGGYRVGGLALSGSALAYYLPLWLAVAAVNALAENLAVLGYPLFRTAQATGWGPAILLAGVVFAGGHLGNPGENPLGIASVFLIGVLMGATIWLTGDLWLSVGLHAGAILAEDALFSVPDSGVTYTGHLLASRLSGPAWLSGGDAGPEGSVLALPVFGILLAVLWIVYRGRRAARDA